MTDDLLDELGVNKHPNGINMTILHDETTVFLSLFIRRKDNGSWEWWPVVVFDGECIEDVVREQVTEHHRIYQ